MLESLHQFVLSLPFGATLWTAFMFIFVLSILVFIHELGHYLAARSVGIRVKAFSIGFGKEIWGFDDKNGCRWKVSLIPLGGYVNMMEDEKADPNDKAAFSNKSVYARFWAVVAGPLANFIFAVVALMALFATSGEQVMKPTVGAVVEGMPAQEAGLVKGDTILSVNGVDVKSWQDMSDYIGARGGERLLLKVAREDEILTVFITPKIHNKKNLLGKEVKAGMIGIGAAGETYMVEHPGFSAVTEAVKRTYEMSALTLEGLKSMILQEIPADVGGPVTIAKMAGDSASYGIYALIMFMVLISINLGLLNLLPIPVLDGGHLLFYTFEILLGRPLNEKVQEYGYRFGFAVVISLMIFALYKDTVRVIIPALSPSEVQSESAQTGE